VYKVKLLILQLINIIYYFLLSILFTIFYYLQFFIVQSEFDEKWFWIQWAQQIVNNIAVIVLSYFISQIERNRSCLSVWKHIIDFHHLVHNHVTYYYQIIKVIQWSQYQLLSIQKSYSTYIQLYKNPCFQHYSTFAKIWWVFARTFILKKSIISTLFNLRSWNLESAIITCWRWLSLNVMTVVWLRFELR
jgi:hypothetical protein